jgi:DNA-binding protein H-NS
MQNGENGKNGKEKEIDRLLNIIDSVARVDEKLDVFTKECSELEERVILLEREGAKVVQERINDLQTQFKEMRELIETSRKEIATLTEKCNTTMVSIEKQKSEYQKYKWIWGAITFFIVPCFTYLLTKVLNVIFHIPI